MARRTGEPVRPGAVHGAIEPNTNGAIQVIRNGEIRKSLTIEIGHGRVAGPPGEPRPGGTRKGVLLSARLRPPLRDPALPHLLEARPEARLERVDGGLDQLRTVGADQGPEA